MSNVRIAVITVVAAGLVLLVAAVIAVAPLWTGPTPPAGATRLHIAVAPPGLGVACPVALLAPVRIATDGDDLVLVGVESGETVPVVWPSGFAAWRVDGHAELAGPYGNIAGRDGDVLDDLGGGLGADDVFHICDSSARLAGLVDVAPWFLLALSIALVVVVVAVPRALLARRGAERPSAR